jgi:hypothetical protein
MPAVLSPRLSKALSTATTTTHTSNNGQPTQLGLFTYGTLTMDSVIHALLGRVPPSQATTAPGWRAAGLPDLPSVNQPTPYLPSSFLSLVTYPP